MKLLLDQGMSASAAAILRGEGVDIVHTEDVGLSAAEDDEIIEWCRNEGRTIFTLDSDFHQLLALSKARSQSVVRIRMEGLRSRGLAELVQRILRETGDDLINGAAVTVTDSRTRIHRLPIARK
jgi:predicted nuclease of predicted toxin-antitoxin system